MQDGEDGAVRSRVAGAWAADAAAVGASPAAAVAALEDLRARYGEPHRRYHVRAHIHDVLAVLAAGPAAEDPVAVRLAAWFHDAVYDPRAADNEAASAALAVRTLAGWGAPDPTVRRVRALVLATDHRRPPPDGDGDAALLVDADLAILAAEPERYDAYVAAVRAEYAQVDDAAWRTGRAAVLDALLARRPLYRTAAAGARGEDRARANLARERATLTSDSSGDEDQRPL